MVLFCVFGCFGLMVLYKRCVVILRVRFLRVLNGRKLIVLSFDCVVVILGSLK